MQVQLPRLIGFVLIILGVVLLMLGLRAMDSFASQFSNFFTGSVSDRAMWLTIGGVAGIIGGAVLAWLPTRATDR